MGRIGEEGHEVDEATRRDLHVPLLHSKIKLLEEHGVFLDICVSVCIIGAVGVIGQDALHEFFDPHVQQLGDLLDHDLAIDLVLGGVEFVLSLRLLVREEVFTRLCHLQLHVFLHLVMVVVGVVLVMSRSIFVLVLIVTLAHFFSSLEEL